MIALGYQDDVTLQEYWNLANQLHAEESTDE